MNKTPRKAFTVVELIALLIIIALFYIGYKIGFKFLIEHFPEYKGNDLFGILALTASIGCGLLFDAIFIASSFCFGMAIEKKKELNKTASKSPDKS